MNVVIAGAGEVGQHVAAVLAAENHQITLIDAVAKRLDALAETLDVRTLNGSATHGDVLLEADTDRADLFVAATRDDEINLLAAAVAKGFPLSVPA